MTPLFSIFYRSWSIPLRENAALHESRYEWAIQSTCTSLGILIYARDIFFFVSELRGKPKICSNDAPGLVRGLLWRHLKLPLRRYNEICRGPVRSLFVVVCSVKRILCKWNICHTRSLRQVFLFRGACFYAHSCDFINVLGLALRSRSPSWWNDKSSGRSIVFEIAIPFTDTRSITVDGTDRESLLIVRTCNLDVIANITSSSNFESEMQMRDSHDELASWNFQRYHCAYRANAIVTSSRSLNDRSNFISSKHKYRFCVCLRNSDASTSCCNSNEPFLLFQTAFICHTASFGKRRR